MIKTRIFVIYYFINASILYSQNYCIDLTDYFLFKYKNNRTIDNKPINVIKEGAYPDYNSCETERRQRAYDEHFLNLTKCIPCNEEIYNNSDNSNNNSIDNLNSSSDFEIRENAIREDEQRKELIKQLKIEESKNKNIWKNNFDLLIKDIKMDNPPISSLQPDEYNKALNEAYYSSYITLEMAKLVSSMEAINLNKLITDLEIAKANSGLVFDDIVKKYSLKAISKKNFSIPDVVINIYDDSRYISYKKIEEESKNIISEYEQLKIKKDKINTTISQINEKKESIEKNIEKIKNENNKKDTNLLQEALKLKEDVEKESEKILIEEKKLDETKKQLDLKLNNLEKQFNNINN